MFPDILYRPCVFSSWFALATFHLGHIEAYNTYAIFYSRYFDKKIKHIS